MAKTIIFEEQSLSFLYVEDFGCFACPAQPMGYVFQEGHEYTVVWDGESYTRTAFSFTYPDGSECVAVGNPMAAGGESNGDLFCIACDTTHGYIHYLSLEQKDTHTVAIYQNAEEVEQPMTAYVFKNEFTQADLKNLYDTASDYSNDGMYSYVLAPFDNSWTIGVMTMQGLYAPYLTYDGLSVDVWIDPLYASMFGASAGWNHTDGVTYTALEEPPFVEMLSEWDVDDSIESILFKEQVGIVLKDFNGNDSEPILGVEKVKLNTSDGGTVIFSKGEAVENVPIELNFAGGDMAITADKGTLVKSAVIKKPVDLVPENIVKGACIAGVEGNSTGGEKVDKTVTLAMANGDQIISADDGTVLGSVTVKKPPNLVPNNIISGVDIGGVVGEYSAPKLYPPNSALLYKTGSPSYIQVYKYYDNGYFPIEAVLYANDPQVEVARKAVAANSSTTNTYLYAYDCTSVEPTKLENIQARFECNGFAPSEFKTYSGSLYLVGAQFDLQNCALDNAVYTRYFAGDGLAVNLVTPEGYYIPKSIHIEAVRDGMSTELSYNYDNFTGQLTLTMPEAQWVNISATAVDTPWLHDVDIKLDEVERTITVDYIDKNATDTQVICNGESIFSLADNRTGMIGYEVTETVPGASYGFGLQADGYYEELTMSKTSTAAVCRIDFDMATESTVTLQYVHYGYSSYDYGVISKVDCALSTSYSSDIDTSSSKVYTNFKSSNSTAVKTLTLTIPAGKHFIDIKYRHYYSSNNSYYFKFKILTEPATKTSYSLDTYFPHYGIYPLTIQSIANGYTPSEVIQLNYANGPTMSIDIRSVLTVTDIIEGVDSINLYVDDVVVATLPYDYSENWSINLNDYATDEELHKIYIEAVGVGIAPNRSNSMETWLIYVPIYGVSNMIGEATTMTRTDNSVGMSWVIDSNYNITSDFDNVFPWCEMKDVTDENGNIFVQFPEMYFRVGCDSNWLLTDIAVAKKPIGDGRWYKVEPFCYSKYSAKLSGNKLMSTPGDLSTFYYNDCISYLANTGIGYRLVDVRDYTILKFLYWIETAKKQLNYSNRTASTSQQPYHLLSEFAYSAVGNKGIWCTGVDATYNSGSSTLSASVNGKKVTMEYTPAGTLSVGYSIIAYGWSDSYPFRCFMPQHTTSVPTLSTSQGLGYSGGIDTFRYATNQVLINHDQDINGLAAGNSASNFKGYVHLVRDGKIEG